MRWLILSALLLSIGLKAQSLDDLKTSPPPLVQHGDWVDPLWRSAICPGWGQEYNKDETKAWVIGGTTWGLFAGVVGTYFWATQAESNYSGLGAGHSQSDFEGAYSNWENASTANHVCYVLFGLAYAYNLFDATTSFKSATGMTLQPGREPLSVELSLVRF